MPLSRRYPARPCRWYSGSFSLFQDWYCSQDRPVCWDSHCTTQPKRWLVADSQHCSAVVKTTPTRHQGRLQTGECQDHDRIKTLLSPAAELKTKEYRDKDHIEPVDLKSVKVLSHSGHQVVEQLIRSTGLDLENHNIQSSCPNQLFYLYTYQRKQHNKWPASFLEVKVPLIVTFQTIWPSIY